MEFRTEYYRLEKAIRAKADELRLVDAEYNALVAQKMAKFPEARAEFHNWFRRETLPKLPQLYEINAIRLGPVIDHIYQQYYFAFCQKTAYGERCAALNPDPRPFRYNMGDKIGTTAVDIVTNDAMSWLSHTYITDTATGEYRELGDEEAVKILGPTIHWMVQSLAHVSLAPREDLMQPYILKVDPQPSGLRMSPADIAAKIWNRPETGAETWGAVELVEDMRIAGAHGI